MSTATFWWNFALTVFFIIAVSLGVTLFVFYQKNAEAEMRIQAVSDAIALKNGDLMIKQNELNEIKKKIDGAETQKTSAQLVEDHDKQMKTYAENFNKENRSYSSVLAYLYNQIQVQNYTLDANQQDIADLTAFNDNRSKFNATATSGVDSKVRKLIAEDKAAYIKVLDEIRNSLQSQKANLENLAKLAGTASTQAVAALNAEFNKANQKTKELVTKNLAVRAAIQKTEVPVTDSADGVVQYVSAASGKATISLGSADRLNIGTSFSVYSSTETDMENGAKKGSLEVVDVIGAHLAECRVVSDNPSDPILPGDKIYSPVGISEHYAIAGFIDLDHDDKNDVARLVRIIESSGGIVDGYQDGAKQVRRLEETTNVLVLGRQPDEKTKEQELLTYQNFIKAANEFGTKQTDVKDLLNKMGVDLSKTNVIMGDADTTTDASATRKSSGGSVSGLYMDSPGNSSEK